MAKSASSRAGNHPCHAAPIRNAPTRVCGSHQCEAQDTATRQLHLVAVSDISAHHQSCLVHPLNVPQRLLHLLHALIACGVCRTIQVPVDCDPRQLVGAVQLAHGLEEGLRPLTPPPLFRTGHVLLVQPVQHLGSAEAHEAQARARRCRHCQRGPAPAGRRTSNGPACKLMATQGILHSLF